MFYDELVSPEILDRIRRDTTRVPVGRRVGKPGIGQDAINRLLIEAAQVRPARRAAEGRRSLRVRPRRRRGRSAARRGRRLFDRARHHRRARRRRRIRSAADLPQRGAAHHLPHRAQGRRCRERRLVDADRHQDDRRGLHGHDRGAVGARGPARRRPFAGDAGRRFCPRRRGRCARPRSARSNDCLRLSNRIEAVPPSSSSATSSRIPRPGAAKLSTNHLSTCWMAAE